MRKMTAPQLRKAFLEFFERQGHKVFPSVSLLPADPTSLFTSAGMQPFVPYLSGEADPPKKRACSVQKCLRIGDIELVGDRYHHTFFEMLGNWSFGDYFKRGAIDFSWDFLVNFCELPKERLWASVFKGQEGIAKDEEARELWLSKGVPQERIVELGMEDNFWGPVAKTGPCGPCSEIIYDLKGVPCSKGPDCRPECDCQRFVEIWNLVFMEYNKTKEGRFERLPKQNVDTGVGFERLLSILQQKPSGYETDLFWPVLEEIERLSAKNYQDCQRSFRIIADHLRAASFVVSEGVLPSNVDRGYVLRRILRRMIKKGQELLLPKHWYAGLVKKISQIYGQEYPEVRKREIDTIIVIQKEEERFGQCLIAGMRQLEKIIKTKKQLKERAELSGQEAFDLYQSYGFPLELIKEAAQELSLGLDELGFERALQDHKAVSRRGAEKKFGGVGIEQIKDLGDRLKAKRLHTATHLLQAALREVLGSHVQQLGSDVSPERLRFDFSHSSKMTPEEIDRVQEWVNQKIKAGLTVKKTKMPLEKAIESGALAFFKERYPKTVTVFSIQGQESKVFSQEICQGPHVKDSAGLGTLRIIKEESMGEGARRIKAVLE